MSPVDWAVTFDQVKGHAAPFADFAGAEIAVVPWRAMTDF
jgi:hypothetical protein